MTGSDVRRGRKARGWTQGTLANRLGVSQGYVSLLESDGRAVPGHLAPKLVSLLGLPLHQLPASSSDPLRPDRVAGALGSLGYPGFEHLRSSSKLNPAEVLLRALRTSHVDARVVEALPWVLLRFPDVDWPWLLATAKQHDMQNRLGFVVTVARELAERRGDAKTASTLQKWEQVLEHSRLQREDAFAGATLTEAERRWLRDNRSPEAAHWNLLSRVSAATLSQDAHFA